MLEFQVEDMTCGHCVSTITKAIKGADANASVEVDLAKHLVRVEGSAGGEEIADAIREAGYTPVPSK
ncbi:heavy-metal-associated domain-containing protein [Noviherbaspirillum massiliense]|uniref:heavy-metal-associated domain-containing protein n=1 Tax=Noviherbaspirillum massiliense TaxID=1465823 RepID=UPI0003194E94|nr:heavy-metal-associated domain-containing protein [Noviherbaspirillum massiliense]